MRLHIEHHKQECFGFGPQLCFLATKEGGEPELFYESIRGFDYQWGYDYELEVEASQDNNPPADASTIVYTLADVVTKQPRRGASFEMTLTVGEGCIVEIEDSIFEIYQERAFVIPPTAGVDELRALLDDSVRLSFVFEHPQDLSQPLLVRAWTRATATE